VTYYRKCKGCIINQDFTAYKEYNTFVPKNQLTRENVHKKKTTNKHEQAILFEDTQYSDICIRFIKI
jgi:hypothetical protein